MYFRVLGPVTVERDGLIQAFGSPKERGVLAHLLARANEVLPTQTLVDGLWGEDAPATADKTLHAYVARLRRNLANGNGSAVSLETRGRGYVLHVDPAAVDAAVFERLAEAGRRRLAAGDPYAAAALLTAALGLWRGAPYADVATTPFAQGEADRLTEVRRLTVEDRIEAEQALGVGAHLVPELEQLVGEMPLRERLWALLMVALVRSGRQSDALAAYQQARSVLVDELGVEPGEALRAVHAAVLDQAPSLEPAPPAAPALSEVVLPAEQTALVGRDDELAALTATWQQVCSGAGQAVAIIGPPGSGKSRMLRELLRGAAGAASLVIAGSGAGLDPVAAMGRQLFGTQIGDLLAANPTMAHVAGAVGDYLGNAGRRQPVLVAVDGAHVSAAGVESLQHLSSRIADTSVMVAVTSAASIPSLDAPAVVLGPLQIEDLHRLAALVVGVEDAPAATAAVAPRSGGWPGTALPLLIQWAEDAAQDRVAASVQAVAAGRGGVRGEERALTDNVVRLRALRSTRQRREDVHPTPAVCPFKGLARFDAADAPYFFGRERLVAEAVASMIGAGLLAIIGASGSGKSSVVRAGLLPALASGVLPGSDTWDVVVMRPGEQPMTALSHALGGDGDAIELRGDQLLVVDQLEEVFTAATAPEQRQTFLDALTRMAPSAGNRAAVVVTLRSDFFGHFATDRDFARLLSARQLLVGPMETTELRRAVEGPGDAAGLAIEAGLSDALVADTAAEPGGLPLLSTALLELWQRRRGNTLSLESYLAAGRVNGAVARLAESAYEALEPQHRDAARRILLRLADAGDGSVSEMVRRRVRLVELDADQPDVAAVLQILTDRRLLTMSDATVEVAHEALLREWPRLRAWLEEDVEGRRLHHHLARASREWDEGGRQPAELYRGARLAGALAWADEHHGDLNTLERAFLDAARNAAEFEARRVRRSNRRLRGAVTGVAAALVLALAAGGFAVAQRQRANAQAVAADARRLGAQALLDPQLDRSLLLAVEATKASDSMDTHGALLAGALRSPQATAIFRGDRDRLLGLAVTPDGRRVVLGDNDGTVTFLRPEAADSESVHVQSAEPMPIETIELDPSGRRMATEWEGGIGIWDVREQRVTATITELPDVPTGWVWEPDGKTLVVATADGSMHRVDPDTQRRLASPLTPVEGVVSRLEMSRDGTTLVASGGMDVGGITVWNTRSGRIVRRAAVDGIADISPDGRTVAASDAGGQVLLVDVATGARREVAGRHSREVMEVAFSPDGRQVASTSDDATAAVWDVATGERLHELTGHAGRPPAVVFEPSGDAVYTASLDGTAIRWDLTAQERLDHARPPHQPPEPETFVSSGFARSPDGRHFAVPRIQGQVDLIPVDGEGRTRSVPADGPVFVVDYAPDGDTLAVAGEAGAMLLDVASDAPDPTLLPGVQGPLGSAAFSPDGELAAFGGEHGVVLVDPRNGGAVGGALDVGGWAGVLAFSPDGRTLAVGDNQGQVELWDVAGRRRLHTATVDEAEVWSIAWSPDGDIVAAGGAEGRVQLLDAQTWEPIRGQLEPLAGFALRLSFSADATLLAASSTAGTVTLFDVATGRRFGAPLRGTENVWMAAVFDAAQLTVRALSDDGTSFRWDLDAAALQRRACAIAGRTLTPQEWQEAIPGRPYDPACVDGALHS